MKKSLKASILLVFALAGQSSAVLTYYTFEGQITHLYPAWPGATAGLVAQTPSTPGTPVTYMLAIDTEADGTYNLYGQETKTWPTYVGGPEVFYTEILSGDYITSLNGGNPDYHTIDEDLENRNYGEFTEPIPGLGQTVLHVNSTEDGVDISGQGHPSEWVLLQGFFGFEWAGAEGYDSLTEIRFSLTLTDISVCGDTQHPQPDGDYSGDCRVNFLDLAIIASDWTNSYDMLDILEIAENWLSCTDPSGCP